MHGHASRLTRPAQQAAACSPHFNRAHLVAEIDQQRPHRGLQRRPAGIDPVHVAGLTLRNMNVCWASVHALVVTQ